MVKNVFLLIAVLGLTVFRVCSQEWGMPNTTRFYNGIYVGNDGNEVKIDSITSNNGYYYIYSGGVRIKTDISEDSVSYASVSDTSRFAIKSDSAYHAVKSDTAQLAISASTSDTASFSVKSDTAQLSIHSYTSDSSVYSDTSVFSLDVGVLGDLVLDTGATQSSYEAFKIWADGFTNRIAFMRGGLNASPNFINASVDIPFYNATADTIKSGYVVSTDSLFFNGVMFLPTGKLTKNTDLESMRTLAGVVRDDVPPGEAGTAIRLNFWRGNTTSFNNGDLVYVDANGQLTNIEPMPPFYSQPIGRVIISGINGVIGVTANVFNNTDTDVNIQGIANGIVTQRPGIYDTIIGGDLYIDIYNEEYPSTDLPFLYEAKRYSLNTTSSTGKNGAARVKVEWGTATEPQTNYITIDNSGTEPLLKNSTIDFDFEHPRILELSVLDSANYADYGFVHLQRYNNGVDGSKADGLFSKITKRIRLDGSKYYSGLNPTFEIVDAALDSMKFSVSSGVGYQLNVQNLNAYDGSILWVNDPNSLGGFKWIDDLNEVNVDANNNSLRINNTKYGLNIFYVIRSSDYEGYLAVTTPTGSYNDDDLAIEDRYGYAVVDVPSSIKKTAIRVARVVVDYSSGGVITNVIGDGEFQDERGFLLGSTSGSGGGTGSFSASFSDADFNIFHNTAPNNKAVFDASIITGEKTFTLPNASDTILVKSDFSDMKVGYVTADSVRSISTNQDSIGINGDYITSWPDPQQLNINGNQLSITGGNTVEIPSGFTLDTFLFSANEISGGVIEMVNLSKKVAVHHVGVELIKSGVVYENFTADTAKMFVYNETDSFPVFGVRTEVLQGLWPGEFWGDVIKWSSFSTDSTLYKMYFPTRTTSGTDTLRVILKY